MSGGLGAQDGAMRTAANSPVSASTPVRYPGARHPVPAVGATAGTTHHAPSGIGYLVVSRPARKRVRLTELEAVCGPGAPGVEERSFDSHEVRFEVLEGRLTIGVEGEPRELGAGSAVTLPPAPRTGSGSSSAVPRPASPGRCAPRPTARTSPRSSSASPPFRRDNRRLSDSRGSNDSTNQRRETMFHPSTLIDTDFVNTQLTRRAARPGRRGLGRGAVGLEPGRRPAPRYVGIPADAADVVTLVGFARERGLRVAVQGTGHNASAYGRPRQHPADQDRADARGRGRPGRPHRRVEAGVTWGEVAGPAAEHGLFALQGSSHDVGVVGYSLGGGVALARPQARPRVRAPARRGDRRPSTASCGASTGNPTRTCSGRCAAAAATSASSRRSRSSCCRSSTIYAGASSSRSSGRRGYGEWRRWTSDVPEEMTSVGGAASSSRRCPRCRSSCAASTSR